MRSHTFRVIGLAGVCMAFWAVVLLAGCGGGDAGDEERDARIGPPDCINFPETCK